MSYLLIFLRLCPVLKVSCFCPLEYISRFLMKLLVKFCFESFRIFLRFCSVFTIFVPLKWVWCPRNLLRSLWVCIKISNKMISKIQFRDFRILLRLRTLFMILHPENHLKLIKGLWKRCGISQIYFFCLK